MIYVPGEFLFPLNLREHFALSHPVIPECSKFSRCKFRFRQGRSPQRAARRRKSGDGCQPSVIGNFPMGSLQAIQKFRVQPPATAYRSLHWSEHPRARALCVGFYIYLPSSSSSGNSFVTLLALLLRYSFSMLCHSSIRKCTFFDDSPLCRSKFGRISLPS